MRQDLLNWLGSLDQVSTASLLFGVGIVLGNQTSLCWTWYSFHSLLRRINASFLCNLARVLHLLTVEFLRLVTHLSTVRFLFDQKLRVNLTLRDLDLVRQVLSAREHLLLRVIASRVTALQDLLAWGTTILFNRMRRTNCAFRVRSTAIVVNAWACIAVLHVCAAQRPTLALLLNWPVVPIARIRIRLRNQGLLFELLFLNGFNQLSVILNIRFRRFGVALQFAISSQRLFGSIHLLES